MSDPVRVFSDDPGPSSRPRLLAGLAAVLAAVLVAFVVGRATAPATRPRSSTQPRPTIQGPPEPSRVIDGVGVGWPHTRIGAVAALLADSAALGNPSVLLNARRRAQVLSLIATSRYAATFSGAAAQALAQARNSPLGEGLRSGAQTVYLAAPIAYRVVAYAPGAIRVVAYAVSVVGNDQGLAPRATWATSTTTAVWQNGDWRVDSASSSDGPTPALTSSPSDAVTFVGALAGSQLVHDEP